MTGANREAAEMSGVNTRQVVMMSLVIAAVTAGLTGSFSSVASAAPIPPRARTFLISTIAAVVLRTSLFGGEGGMRNTILGLLDLRHPVQRTQSVAEHPDHVQASAARDRAPGRAAAQRLRAAHRTGADPERVTMWSIPSADEEPSQTETERRGQQAERHAASDIERGRVPAARFEEREGLE